MTKIDDGGPAWPVHETWNEQNAPGQFPVTRSQHHNGMTMRDYFAGQFIAGIENWCPAMEPGETVHQARARYAYAFAAAMLAARSKPTEKE